MKASFRFWLLLPFLCAACGQIITITPTLTSAPTPTLNINVPIATFLPTVTPAPYTPEPTATPTSTPTPILHIIQAGESLLAIANRYGVSVAELQDANGILDPRTLQIGQSLIIPRPEEQEDSTLSAQTPTPTPLPIVVENVYLSDAGIGGLFILGEIANTSNTPLEHVRVGVTLLDANGKALSSADSLVALDLVDVGARAPFAILFGETLENYSNYQIAVLRAEPAFLSNYYRDLEIRNLTQKNEGYASYSISGQIANIGPEETQAVQVILTGYDSLGRVIATRKISPEFSVIPQGSATEFSAILAPVGGPLVRIEAIAQGRRKQ